MKKRTFVPLILLIIFISGGGLFAQGIRFGIGGGITNISAPSYYSDNLPSGFNAGIKIKINMPLSPITPIGYLNYTLLRSTKSFAGQDVKFSQNILSIGAGGEFSILPIPGPVSPYLIADVSYNNFGNLKMEPQPLTGIISSGSSSISRFGLGIGVGTDINLIVLKFDLSAKYNMYNLVGKSDNEDTISSIIINLYLML